MSSHSASLLPPFFSADQPTLEGEVARSAGEIFYPKTSCGGFPR